MLKEGCVVCMLEDEFACVCVSVVLRILGIVLQAKYERMS